MVTRWPKHKILNFTTRLGSYGHQVTKTQNFDIFQKDCEVMVTKIWKMGISDHQVTKTQNFEFNNKIGKFWSPGDQNKKIWILQQNREIMVTRWPKHKILIFSKKIAKFWSPGDQNTKFWISQQDCEFMVTRWPKHKFLNFTTRLGSYGHQVTKRQNLEF